MENELKLNMVEGAMYYVRASGFALLIAVSLYITFGALWQLYKLMKQGQPDPERWGNWGERFKITMKGVFGQDKILRNLGSAHHVLIFYGFILVTIVSTEVFIRAFIPNFSLKFMGPGYDALLWIEDIMSIAVIFGILVGFFNRYVIQPIRFEERLEQHSGLNRDATIILFAVGIHIILAIILESLEIALGKHPNPTVPPIAGPLATFWPSEGTTVEVIESVVWWGHSFSVWLFMIYIFGTNIRVPRFYPSKHFHILSAPFNVMTSDIGSPGRIRPMATNMDDFEELMMAAFDEPEEGKEKASFAMSSVNDLRWSDMLDLYSCTGCGRCQELCPAYLNDQPLSPKALILNMRDRLLEKATLEYENPDASFEPDTPLVGDVVPKETLWSCTTCNACVDACPLYIDHLDKIIDMRRHLAMVEADFPTNIGTTFDNIESNSNPWGVGKNDRDKWADELDIKRMKDHPDTDTLFWVGCAGSFDDRAKKVSTSVVKILRAADIDFAILGKEENCTGDPARRMGNEYLALQLMNQNVELLNSYNFKEVITFCPHCFNNLANELPDFGGHYRVVHAVDYVNRLIKEGKLSIDTSEPLDITYHDSCYLGRHNGIYSAPREILANFKGINFVEMEMNQDKGLCCGAGGGRVFYEMEEQTQRINNQRVQMAEDTGTSQIGVSCPFCTIMLEDGVTNLKSKMEVLDLMEIVASHLTN